MKPVIIFEGLEEMSSSSSCLFLAVEKATVAAAVGVFVIMIMTRKDVLSS